MSPRYYETLCKHAVPLDERALGALANSPMALDVYAWLAQRLHRVHPSRPQLIAWKALQDQFGFGFSRLRKFRETFLGALAAVHSQYRGAKVEIDERGITLRCSPPPVKGRLAITPTPRPTAAVEQAPTMLVETPPQDAGAALTHRPIASSAQRKALPSIEWPPEVLAIGEGLERLRQLSTAEGPQVGLAFSPDPIRRKAAVDFIQIIATVLIKNGRGETLRAMRAALDDVIDEALATSPTAE